MQPNVSINTDLLIISIYIHIEAARYFKPRLQRHSTTLRAALIHALNVKGR